MNTISFMTANFVARELGYNMTGGWEQGDRATRERFAPVGAYGARLAEMLDEVVALGFDAVDLWDAHLGAPWATEQHLSLAKDALRDRDLEVASLAGWMGSTREIFEATCRIAVAVGAPVLGGGTSLVDHDRDFVIDALERHGLVLGIENHPERTPAEMLARIGDGAGGRIGTTVDTGWYGTQGYDAARAIEQLARHVVHVHLKDVLHAGTRHETCRYGHGVVPVQRCVTALRTIGYAGAISVEHEPEDADPTEDVQASLAMLRSWLGETRR